MMQKGDAAKLKLLLSGISARLTKNRDFFVQAVCTFTSGKKKFDAQLARTEQGYALRFQGSAREVDAAGFCAFFAEQAEKFDESVLTYTERSAVVTLSVTARGVQMKQAEREATAEEKAAAANPLLDSGRQYLIRVDQAAALLREIGILTADGKLKNDMIRKYNQIDHYVELVAPMFEQDDSEEIVLLDCACGKSYLSFVMNYYLHEVLHRRCRVIGVDINEHVIEESRAMAKRLGYHNMVFQCADLRTYRPPKNVTAVISLHACDIATDLALATAIRARAKYIACVPCCHKELLDRYTLPGLEPLTRFGVFKARFNDVLTDSMRALKLEAEGYKVSVVEYISPLDTPKNLLIRAVRTGKVNTRARQEYDAVRHVLGTTSELDRRCMEMENEFFVTDEDLLQ
ncbi:MAG: class I SAM-dependent methyltransferase [Agathobaculum sp.]